MVPVFTCRHCGAQLALEDIPDEALKIARGRHKSYGIRSQRQFTVWKEHDDLAPRCRCARCLLSYLSNIEKALNARVHAEVARTGVKPAWAERRRQDLRERRAAVEGIVAERLSAAEQQRGGHDGRDDQHRAA